MPKPFSPRPKSPWYVKLMAMFCRFFSTYFLINLDKNTEVQIRETDIYANQILFFLLLVGLKFGHCHHRYMSGMPIIRTFISIEQYYLVQKQGLLGNQYPGAYSTFSILICKKMSIVKKSEYWAYLLDGWQCFERLHRWQNWKENPPVHLQRLPVSFSNRPGPLLLLRQVMFLSST